LQQVERKGSHQTEIAESVPLCVDLDGTLLRTDLLFEGILNVATNWRLLFRLPRLLRSRGAALRQKVAELATLDPMHLPYNKDLLDYLRCRRAAGQSLVLATGADARAARAIADHLGLFDEVISSDGARDLTGETKARVLIERFGRQNFAYAGNDHNDLPVWREAHSIVIVNASSGVCSQARLCGALVEAEFRDQSSLLRSCWRAMRPQLWGRNLLVFVPMILAHAVGDRSAWISALFMFCALCATASGTYLLNDLTDLAADRRHARKCNRPLASGTLSIAAGIAMAVVLIALGGAIAAILNALPLIVVYVLVSVGYSFLLKDFPFVDVIILAGLSTLRVLAGVWATGHTVSLWLLSFLGFLFLNIALMKRADEMIGAAHVCSDAVVPRRGYRPGDVWLLQILGYTATLASGITLAVFLRSSAGLGLYGSPELLWGLVPLLLLWQCRLWLAAVHRQMHDDPIVYVARDWASWLVVACVFVLFVAAY
jgi:4-hydroxybenzoate polyprenyltransferase/phosphoserine phosphatase